MDKFRGTVFAFQKVQTGEIVKAFSNNKTVWAVKVMIPKLNEDMEETDELIESDNMIPWDKFIQLYRPTEERGKAFLKHCLLEIHDAFQQKIGDINAYLSELQ